MFSKGLAMRFFRSRTRDRLAGLLLLARAQPMPSISRA
jgi:hypothetical protein